MGEEIKTGEYQITVDYGKTGNLIAQMNADKAKVDLRDRMAMAALPHYMASKDEAGNLRSLTWVTECASMMADAMLDAREAK